jgi:hypothetical protein
MPPTVAPPPTRRPTALRRDPFARSRLSAHAPTRSDAHVASGPLARYVDAEARTRELLAVPGHGGSVLVLDRDAATLCDRRLVAHIAADEPPENVALVCRHYLEDSRGRWCRRVCPEDLEQAPFGDVESPPQSPDASVGCLWDGDGNAFRLAPLPGNHAAAQLRWWRRRSDSAEEGVWEPIKLRDVVGALESYEPVRALTENAIACHRDDPDLIVARLGRELERLCTSPVVLNRGLREGVLDAINRGGATMSEIAFRCGVVKRDHRGKPSGETSWLARRIGVMPEGGASTITPWIHSDVLAVIARDGLGVSPREVELQ